jgi:sulfite reductase alpha subunit-like flavoprotein
MVSKQAPLNDGANPAQLTKTPRSAGFSADRFLDNSSRVVLLLATHGVGNPTKSAQALHTWLNDATDSGAQAAHKAGRLDALRCSVFGLGNSSYGKTYNQMGRQTWKRLTDLCGGDGVLHAYGEGDANVDATADDATEQAFLRWSESLLESLVPAGGVVGSPGVGDTAAAAAAPSAAAQRPTYPWVLRVLPSSMPAHCISALRGVAAKAGGAATCVANLETALWDVSDCEGGTFEATVTRNEELRADTKDGSTRLMELEFAAKGAYTCAAPVSSCSVADTRDGLCLRGPRGHHAGLATNFEAADTVEVLPRNRAADVQRLATLQGFDLDELVTLEPAGADISVASSSPPFPVPCLVSEALGSFVDLAVSPKRSLLRSLAFYACKRSEVRVGSLSARKSVGP